MVIDQLQAGQLIMSTWSFPQFKLGIHSAQPGGLSRSTWSINHVNLFI